MGVVMEWFSPFCSAEVVAIPPRIASQLWSLLLRLLPHNCGPYCSACWAHYTFISQRLGGELPAPLHQEGTQPPRVQGMVTVRWHARAGPAR